MGGLIVFIVLIIVVAIALHSITAPGEGSNYKESGNSNSNYHDTGYGITYSSSYSSRGEPSAKKRYTSADDKPKSGMFIVFDTETTGLPGDYDAPASDVNNWPRMVQLSWIIIYASSGRVIRKETHIIKPEGYEIPQASTAIHGITTEDAMKMGEDLETVLKKFTEEYNSVDAAIGHNVEFDVKVVTAELYRKKLPKLKRMKKYCTKKLGTPVCCIPKEWGNGYKWPTLQELYRYLFNEPFYGGHDAGEDAEAARKCFVELRNRGDVPGL